MRQFWMMLAGVVFAGTAMAAEKSDFGRDQAAINAATAPAIAGGDCEALTSMKGTGKIRVGGDVILKYVFSKVKDSSANKPAGWGNNSTMYASEWEPDTANLNFQVQACDNGKLFISLDLTDPWNNHRQNGPTANDWIDYDQDDILDQIYFTLENICGTGFGVTFGKTNIPFGMGRDDLALHPYMSDYGETFLQGERNGWTHANNWNWGYEGPHSYSYDPRFALIPFFKIGETLKAEVAIFQDIGNNGYASWGRAQSTSGRYTNDPGISFAGRLTWNPIEDLTISGSAITRYNTDAKNSIFPAGSPNNGLKGVDRAYATSLGFDWNPCFFSKKFNIFAEWQHAWDPEFLAKTSSDNIYTGVSFDVTEAVTLFAQYEYLRTRYKPEGGNSNFQKLQRAIIAAQYAFGSGMYVEAGYQHEWGKDNVGSAKADVLYTAFGWGF